MAKKLKHNYGNQVYHIFFHRPEGLDWAQNTTNGNMSWSNNILYSYSSELGWADFDKKIIWIRNGSYSNTTSNHQRLLRWAVPSDWYKVYIYEWHDWSRFSGAPDYRPQLKHIVNLAKENKAKLYSGNKYFGDINFIDNYKEAVLNILYKIGKPELYDNFEKEISEYDFNEEEKFIHNVKTWCIKNNITGSYETKLKVYNNPGLAKEIIEKNRVKKERLEATKEDRKLKAIQKSVEKWYSGDSNSVLEIGSYNRRTGYCYYSTPVYLRIKPSDNKVVQTSRSAEIPLIECQLLYRKFKQCKDSKTTWKQNGEKIKIGRYQVDRIEEYNGEYQIISGCHIIKNTQIEEFVNRFTSWNKNE